MPEVFTIAGLSAVLLINAIQIFLSVIKRIRRSSCVNSAGAGINVEFESKSKRGDDGDDGDDGGGRQPKHKSI